jgi:hypothetical protein
VWYAVTHRDRSAGQHSGADPSPGGSAGATAATGVSGTAAHGGAPDGYAACTVAGISAYCPKQPLCWGQITQTGGPLPTASRIDCDDLHFWESFAAGTLPAGAMQQPSDKLLTDPTVGKVCGGSVLAARSRSPGDTQGWTVQALPQAPASGPRIFHCLAAPATGGEWRSHAFISG